MHKSSLSRHKRTKHTVREDFEEDKIIVPKQHSEKQQTGTDSDSDEVMSHLPLDAGEEISSPQTDSEERTTYIRPRDTIPTSMGWTPVVFFRL